MKKTLILLTLALFACSISIHAQLAIQLGQTIAEMTGDDEFAHSISMSEDGKRVAIGAPQIVASSAPEVDPGYVEVYEYDDTNGSWVQIGNKIIGEAMGDQFGSVVSLSVDGNRLAVGAPENEGYGPGAGHVRIFEYNSHAIRKRAGKKRHVFITFTPCQN